MDDEAAKEIKALRSGVMRQYKKLLSTMGDWLESDDDSYEGSEIYDSLVELYEQLEASFQSTE
ncbi:MAG: hypothetical protein ACRCYY_07545 [Trueperaceae bacterium]